MNTVMHTSSRSLDEVKRIGTGLAFIAFPLIFVFAFAAHPGLLTPHRLTDTELILREHGNALLAFGHAMVVFDAAILVAVSIGLMRILDGTKAAWAGFIGTVLTIVSAVALGAEKGAESLSISAMDSLPEAQFTQMMPGLIAVFAHRGWMILVMGVLLLAVGLTIQAIALLVTGAVPRWQAALLLGVWLMGWPDGEEIVALAGSILLAIGMIPIGIRIFMMRRERSNEQVSKVPRQTAVRARPAHPASRR